MIVCGEVVRWPIAMPPSAAEAPGDSISFGPLPEIRFRRNWVAIQGDRHYFCYQCEDCRMQNTREARLFTTHIFEFSYTGNVPDDIEMWLRDHAEMHRVMALWWKGIAGQQQRPSPSRPSPRTPEAPAPAPETSSSASE